MFLLFVKLSKKKKGLHEYFLPIVYLYNRVKLHPQFTISILIISRKKWLQTKIALFQGRHKLFLLKKNKQYF